MQQISALIFAACVIAATTALAQAVDHAGSGPARRAHAVLDARAEVGDIVRLVNAFRQQEGRGGVTEERRLATTAQDFAEFMARTGRYGHEADGRSPDQRAQAQAYAYCVISENIAFQQRSSGFASGELARLFVEGWRNSPVHRHNMLDEAVTDTGVGLARSNAGRWYAVQMFGLPESARIRFDVANDTGVTVRYRLGDETFELPPRVTRTHSQCKARDLTLLQSNGSAAGQLHPSTGAHYRIVPNGSGSWHFAEQR